MRFWQGKLIKILLGDFTNDFEAQEEIILYVGGRGERIIRYSNIIRIVEAEY